MRLHRRKEADVILSQTLQKNVVSLGQLGVVQQVSLRNRQQQLDVGVERVVQGIIAVKSGANLIQYYNDRVKKLDHFSPKNVFQKLTSFIERLPEIIRIDT